MKCEISNGEINYEIHGNGRPLLVLHGGYLDHRHMVDVMEPVFESNSDWMRIYPDMPGHGLTTIADSIGSHDQVLDVMEEFINQICPKQNYVVAGESRGGFIARGLAARNPDSIDGLLLIVPGRHAVADPEYLPPQVILEKADELIHELSENEVGRFNTLILHVNRLCELFAAFYSLYHHHVHINELTS